MEIDTSAVLLPKRLDGCMASHSGCPCVDAAIRRLVAEVVVRELETAGDHEGPCTDPDGYCDLHIDAWDNRVAAWHKELER